MNIKKTSNDIIKIIVSLLFAGVILFWMYRGYDFGRIKHVLFHGMNWMWMLLSFPFGILAQMFRGWRWRQTLEPLGEYSRQSVRIHSVFLSYAVSLVIPRIGEFARCGVLKRYDGVSFAKALGTVVTERAVDSVLVLAVTGFTLLAQINVFNRFFNDTDTSLSRIFMSFSTTGYIITAICGIAVIILLYFILRRLSIYNKVEITLKGIWQGIISVKNVKNIPLFILFSIAIWSCYFLHYYFTFFCFAATTHLNLMCALCTFVVGSIAVIVPTPNGAGPWHFAVSTMLMLYGVSAADALSFVLIVHTVQTALVILLGIYAWFALSFTNKRILTI